MMRLILAATVLAMATGSMAIAGDKTAVPGHNGLTIGHDGKLWRMEGCAAYPVEAEAGGHSKPVAAAPPAVTTPPAVEAGTEDAAEEKLAKSDKPAE